MKVKRRKEWSFLIKGKDEGGKLSQKRLLVGLVGAPPVTQSDGNQTRGPNGDFEEENSELIESMEVNVKK